MATQRSLASRTYLGIEGGATRTLALLADGAGREVGRFTGGPANCKLLTDAQLAAHCRMIGAALPCPGAVGIGLAGAWSEADRERIRRAAQKAWPHVPCAATHDLEVTLLAAGEDAAHRPAAQVLLLSGTGSCCYGRNATGQTAKVGGWGHLLGDQGSGYDIGFQALRAVACRYDARAPGPALGARFLRRLQLNEPNDLIDWAQSAAKAEIADLAVEVFAAWQAGDGLARRLVEGAADSLAADAARCAGRLARPGARVRFVLAGGVLLKQPRFARMVAGKLRAAWPGAAIGPLPREGAWGAVELARRALQTSGSSLKPQASSLKPPLVTSSWLSPTEARNARSTNLDKMPVGQAVALFLSEESAVARNLLAERGRLARGVGIIARAFRRGGRLFYVGAGTSGRLGVLDASECPPTFRTPPELVQGVIAGGRAALWSSVEGAEDDRVAGARAMGERGVRARDVVVGIAASGTTPFVWGALGAAHRRGATTMLVCFNPYVRIPRALRPGLMMAPNLGPELLTGSTRLKAGTATKIILNLLSTLAMVRLGKVRSNLMIDLDPSNAKLRGRAVRIVQALTAASEAEAQAALERKRWRVKEAVALLERRGRAGTPKSRGPA
jgi:N-acetylmuramic acid 6-phosphate etherase